MVGGDVLAKSRDMDMDVSKDQLIGPTDGMLIQFLYIIKSMLILKFTKHGCANVLSSKHVFKYSIYSSVNVVSTIQYIVG